MEKVTGSENRGPLSELETEAEAEEEEPGAAALEDPEEQPANRLAARTAEQRSAMPLRKCFFISVSSFLFKMMYFLLPGIRRVVHAFILTVLAAEINFHFKRFSQNTPKAGKIE